jgi:hypothetical protein
LVLKEGSDTNPRWERLTAKGRQAPRKQFFFEKKNQKTFTLFNTCQSYQSRQPTKQKSFGSFLQKRTASLLRWCVSPNVGLYETKAGVVGPEPRYTIRFFEDGLHKSVVQREPSCRELIWKTAYV